MFRVVDDSEAIVSVEKTNVLNLKNFFPHMWINSNIEPQTPLLKSI